MKKCILCNQDIHPKRLEILPNAKTCVNCSTTQPKGGITITRGEGDHTYTETVILEHEDYIKYNNLEDRLVKPLFSNSIDSEREDEETEVESDDIDEVTGGVEYTGDETED